MNSIKVADMPRKQDGVKPGDARCPAITMQEIVARDDNPPPPVLAQESYRFLGDADIPVERYYAREFFDLEMQQMWPRAWQWACREEHIPEVGDTYLYEIGSHSILVVNTEQGIKAYYNSCLHRSTKFVMGEGTTYLEKIRCPFHGWTWNLDGSLAHVPCAWDFPHVEPDKYRLPEVRVELWGGFVFINMDVEAESLEDFMAPMPEHFANWRLEDTYIGLHTSKILPCNWKAGQEAFVEAYHSMQTHPQLMRTVIDANTQYDVFSHNVSRFYAAIGVSSPLLEEPLTEAQIAAEMVTGDRDSIGEFVMAEGDTARKVMSRQIRESFSEHYGRDLSHYSDSEVIDGIEYGLFPNMIIFPGLSLPMVYRFRPIGMDTDKCLFEILWLRPVPGSGERPEPAEPQMIAEEDSFNIAVGLDKAFAAIYDQDTGNLRAQQEGLRNARKGQTLANYQEVRIRHFHQTLDRYLTEKKSPRNSLI